MCVTEMMQLAGQIQTLGLPREQEEVLMVQAADLVRFKESFEGDLQLIDPFSHRVSIVNSKEGMAGICFYGHEDKGALPQLLKETKRFKRLKKAKEVWLVFIASPQDEYRPSHSGLIAQHNIKQFCNRIFLLDYFNATLRAL
ncbi:MAG: hypothetical protein V4581_13900 [Bacteroidota bacterium]